MPTVPAVSGAMRRAILRMIASSFFFAVMGALVKASTGRLPFLVALVFRNVVSVIPLAAWFAWTGLSFRPRRGGLLLVRSALGFGAMAAFFLAIEHLPLSTATVLNFSSPVFVVLFSALLLRESIAGRVLPFVLAAFAGVAILVGPEWARSGVDVAVGLASAVLAALAYVTVRTLSRTEPPARIVLYFALWSSVFSAVLLAGAMAAGWEAVSPGQVVAALSDPWQVAALCGVGLAGMLGQLFLTASYAGERASVVSAFQYTGPVFSYVFGIAFFGDPATLRSLLGGAVIVGGSLGVLYVSQQRRPGPTTLE